MMLSQLSMVGMGVTDVLVAGQAGTADLAAITIGAHLWELSMLMMYGVMLANGPLIGQALGAGKPRDLRHQFQQCLWLALPLSLLCALAIGAASGLLGVLSLEAEVRSIAADYLLPISLVAALVPFSLTLRTTYEGLGEPRPVMRFWIAAFLLNIPLDYVLVLGAFGWPGLGGAGCGWASLIAYGSLQCGVLLHSRLAPTLRRYRLYEQFAGPDWPTIRHTLAIGLPIGLSMLSVGGFFAVAPLLLAALGSTAVAGHGVAITVDWMMLMVPMGIAQAITVRVAHEAGAGRPPAAVYACTTGLALVAAVALLQAALTVLLRQPIVALFSDDGAVVSLAADLLLFAAAFRLFDAMQIAAGAALRGYKDTRVASAINLVCYWLIGLPLAYTLATEHLAPLPTGVRGFWLGMLLCIVCNAVAMNWRLWYTCRRSLSRIPVPHEPASH